MNFPPNVSVPKLVTRDPQPENCQPRGSISPAFAAVNGVGWRPFSMPSGASGTMGSESLVTCLGEGYTGIPDRC